MPSPEDFSKEQLKEAIIVFIKNTENPTVKTVRRGVSVKLGMEPKALDVRKEEIKKLAYECIELLDNDPEQTQENANNDKVHIEEPLEVEKPVKNVKKKKQRKKRKRKQKKSDSNNSSFVVDDVSDGVAEALEENSINSDVEAYSASEEEEEKPKRKTKRARTSKRSTKAATGRLGKLRRLAKITGNTNPKLYQLLKTMSEKKQINHLEELFDKLNIDYSDLSKSALQRIKEESNLEREVAELGGAESIINEGARTRRKRKKVNYNLQMMSRIEDQSEESGQENDDENNDEDEAEDFYEPSNDEGSDYAPSDQ